VDKALEGTGIVNPPPDVEGTWADTPVLKAFVVRDPYGSSSESVDRFYKQLDKYEGHEKFLKEMLKLDEQKKFDAYKAKHPDIFWLYDFAREENYSSSARYFRKIASQMSDIRNRQKEVYASRAMTPREKRRVIDETNKAITVLARKALAKYRDVGKPVARVEPAVVPTANGRARAETWEEMGPKIHSSLMFALAAYWGEEKKPFTETQRQGLTRVFKDNPLGQTSFNAWLAILRQAAQASHLQGQ
jgi:hypothetical protein